MASTSDKAGLGLGLVILTAWGLAAADGNAELESRLRLSKGKARVDLLVELAKELCPKSPQKALGRASCKKIRDDGGYWHQVEAYVEQHSEAEFSHGLCPECVESIYPGHQRRRRRKSSRELSPPSA